jgi:hypothetical protein
MFIQMYQEKFMRFPNGCQKAITFSYDDGVQADVHLLAIFKKYGLKGTFNLNSRLFDCNEWHGHMDEEATFATFKDCEQEIAMHGARHIFLNRVPLPEAIKEITDNRAYLEGKFGKIVRGFAYPYNSYTDEILQLLPSLGVVYGRTTQSTHAFTLPQNWLMWNPTCHHGDVKLQSLLNDFLTFNPSAQLKERNPLLFYIWGHSYEFDDKNNWQIIEGVGEKIAGCNQDIWCATNIEIYNYITCYNALIYSQNGNTAFNPSYMPVWVEVRGKVYKIESGQTVTFEG